MGKYSGCLTTKEVCKYECDEADKILSKYRVSKEDTKEIIDIIEEAYHQLHISCNSGCAYENTLNKYAQKFNISHTDIFQEYMHQMAELEKNDNVELKLRIRKGD